MAPMIITAQMKAGVIVDGAGCADGMVSFGVGIGSVGVGIVMVGMVIVSAGAGGAGGVAVVKVPTLIGPSWGAITCTDQK